MTGSQDLEREQADPLAPFVQKTFIEHLLRAQHQARLYEYKDESEVVFIPEKSLVRYSRWQLGEIR